MRLYAPNIPMPEIIQEYLAISAYQLDEGMLAEVTVEELLAKGRMRRALYYMAGKLAA